MMQSAVIWLSEKLKNEFGFSILEYILEEAKEKERQNCQTSFKIGVKQCDIEYKNVIKSAIDNLKN